MPEVQMLKVFVASPSDVQEEREALHKVVKMVNASITDLEPVQLRLVRWETDTEPAVGADAQAIVNEQIGTDYDIFIGILWTRFGTPTPRAESGTIEEFEQAVERHRQSPSSVSVMFYFKDAPQSPMEIDTDQLEKVQNFRRSFTNTGLYGTFTDTEDFIATLQIRLTRIALGWTRGERQVTLPAILEESSSSNEETEELEDDVDLPDEDEGFLDLVEQGIRGFEEVTAVTQRIKTEIETLGSDFEEGTRQLEQAKDSSGNMSIPKAKQAINRVASTMDRFASRLESEIDPFKNAFGIAIRAYGRAATLLSDFNVDTSEQLEGAIDTARALESSIASGHEPLQELQKTIAEQPRATSRFNHARKKTLEALSALEREMSAARTSTQETMALFEQLLARSQDTEGTQ